MARGMAPRARDTEYTTMFAVKRWARGGMVALIGAATAIGATTVGSNATGATPAADAAQCYERYVSAPINEAGIQCPGNPAIWKSYTFASHGFGYYTETEQLGNGRSIVRLGYKHQDGRIAVSILECSPRGCDEREWNGVPFPFGH
jgi:hypothetical protein